MSLEELSKSDAFYRIAIPVLEGLAILFFVIYKKFASFKVREVITVLFMIAAIAFFTYLSLGVQIISLRIIFVLCAMIMGYTFYWLFMKDNGANKRHLD